MSAKELITEVEYVHKERKLRRKEELVQLGQAGFPEEVHFSCGDLTGRQTPGDQVTLTETRGITGQVSGVESGRPWGCWRFWSARTRGGAPALESCVNIAELFRIIL